MTLPSVLFAVSVCVSRRIDTLADIVYFLYKDPCRFKIGETT